MGRDRFTRTTNSAEGSAPIHGRRCKGRSTPVGVCHPNTCSNSGTRCHLPTRKICKTHTATRFNTRRTFTRPPVSASLGFIRFLEKLTGDPVKGLVGGYNGLVSRNQHPHPPQPIQQHLGPQNMQQFPGRASPMMISPPITPMSSGTGSPPSPGAFDQMSPTSPGFNQQYYSPSSPTGPGIQDFNTSGQNFPLPQSRTMGMAMHPTGGGTHPNHEDDSDLYADANDDGEVTPNYDHSPNQFQGQGQNIGGPPPIHAQAQFSIQVTTPPTGTSGGHGNGNRDPTDPNQSTLKRPTSGASGSSATCRLDGCDKPVFMDQTTGLQSEYCSQSHRE